MNLLQTNPFETTRIQKRPLIIDGAMGSLLQQNGYNIAESTWMTMVNETYPDVVIKIHKNYIKSGADIITTNTFRTNPAALEREGITDFERYVINAVNISKQAIENKSVLIAGSNAPAEDCYQRERTISLIKLKVNHHKHIDSLVNRGVHFILNETFSHFDEIEIVCRYCSDNKIPYVISLYFTEELLLLSGEPLSEGLSIIREHNPMAIGFNCIAPEHFDRAMEQMDINFNWGFYLNCGFDEHKPEKMHCTVTPDDYSEIVKKYLKINPSFIGACCGSSTEHIKAIKKVIDEYTGN